MEADRIPEAAIFARAYLPSKLFSVMELWKKKVEDKPYVPTSLSDIPDNIPVIDLAIRVESALKEYYSQEKPSGAQYDIAFERHFQEIAQQVETGIEHELQKPLFEAEAAAESAPEPVAEPAPEVIETPEQVVEEALVDPEPVAEDPEVPEAPIENE